MNHYFETVEGWFGQTGLYAHVVREFDNARFVEVGSWKGRSTSFMGVEILNSGKNIKLDCVDTFKGSAEHGDVDHYKLFYEFTRNVESVRSVINRVHVMTSLEAAELYRDESLDFVFIDASHDEANVFADCVAWYPKVRKGGIFGGDDYFYDCWPGVKAAVDRFLPQGKQLETRYLPHWYFQK